MSNLKYHHPQTIYTRLNDVFEEDKNKEKEDFNPDNFIKPNLIGTIIEENKKEPSKKRKKNSDYQEQKTKYVNKELVESWIDAIKTSN